MAKTYECPLKKGDRVSFLDFELGVREGVGGVPGKGRCVFGTRRRYTGTVVGTRKGTFKEGAENSTWVIVRPDEGQEFDEKAERDGMRIDGDGTNEYIYQQHSFKKI